MVVPEDSVSCRKSDGVVWSSKVPEGSDAECCKEPELNSCNKISVDASTNKNIPIKFSLGGKGKIKALRSSKERSKTFNLIPGFNLIAKVNSPIDENLAPLNSNHLSTIQYGQTNFTSIDTDNPLWTPGVCLNLHKYEGIFKVKSPGIHQQVVHSTSLIYNMFLFSRFKRGYFTSFHVL